MQIRVQNDSVTIEGYVNAVERKSKPIHSRAGQFVEEIEAGAFQRAIDRNDNIRCLVNHDRTRDLGGTKEGNLELYEDTIGAYARITTDDPEVVEDARAKRLRGWSFGFRDRPGGVKITTDNGMPLRRVSDMDLEEVSIINSKKTPAYKGTSIQARADDDDGVFYGDTVEYEARTEEDAGVVPAQEQPEQPKKEAEAHKQVDYSKYEAIISAMKEDKV